MEKRIYDKWAGNPKGIPEDVTRCIETVSTGAGWHLTQCSLKRCHGAEGLYCKRHARKHERNTTTLAVDLASPLHAKWCLDGGIHYCNCGAANTPNH
jgi:hypothetical protein